MTKTKIFCALLAIAFFSLVASAQYPRFYIAPMEGNFDKFIAAAWIKNKIKGRITKSAKDTDYILMANPIKEDIWYNDIFKKHEKIFPGLIMKISVMSKYVEWAGSAGDKKECADSNNRLGQEKCANFFVKKSTFNLPTKRITLPLSAFQ